jgi:hypothetical protein
MSVVCNGPTYYRTFGASKIAGIARSTLLTWAATQVTEDRNSNINLLIKKMEDKK